MGGKDQILIRFKSSNTKDFRYCEALNNPKSSTIKYKKIKNTEPQKSKEKLMYSIKATPLFHWKTKRRDPRRTKGPAKPFPKSTTISRRWKAKRKMKGSRNHHRSNPNKQEKGSSNRKGGTFSMAPQRSYLSACKNTRKPKENKGEEERRKTSATSRVGKEKRGEKGERNKMDRVRPNELSSQTREKSSYILHSFQFPIILRQRKGFQGSFKLVYPLME